MKSGRITLWGAPISFETTGSTVDSASGYVPGYVSLLEQSCISLPPSSRARRFNFSKIWLRADPVPFRTNTRPQRVPTYELVKFQTREFVKHSPFRNETKACGRFQARRRNRAGKASLSAARAPTPQAA